MHGLLYNIRPVLHLVRDDISVTPRSSPRRHPVGMLQSINECLSINVLSRWDKNFGFDIYSTDVLSLWGEQFGVDLLLPMFFPSGINASHYSQFQFGITSR